MLDPVCGILCDSRKILFLVCGIPLHFRQHFTRWKSRWLILGILTGKMWRKRLKVEKFVNFPCTSLCTWKLIVSICSSRYVGFLFESSLLFGQFYVYSVQLLFVDFFFFLDISVIWQMPEYNWLTSLYTSCYASFFSNWNDLICKVWPIFLLNKWFVQTCQTLK